MLHLPLCAEGMWVATWRMDGEDHLGDPLPKIVHIPFGTMLVLQADASHAGAFGRPGNACFHCSFKHESAADGSKLLHADMAKVEWEENNKD